MSEWIGFQKEGDWQAQKGGGEYLEEKNGPLNTLWTRDLNENIFPQTVERRDRTKEKIIRIITGFKMPEGEDMLLRCRFEQEGTSDGFSSRNLTLNSAGRVWTEEVLESEKVTNEIHVEYDDNQNVSKIELRESFDEPNSPDTCKTQTTTFTFAYSPTGVITSISCRPDSSSITFPPGLFESIQKGEAVRADISRRRSPQFSAISAKVGEEFNLFKRFFYVIEENSEGTIHLKTRFVNEGQEKVTDFVIQKKVLNWNELFAKGIESDEPNDWREIVASVGLSRS